jgi:regulator of protease activity HflC (stomatin/prohibitin superfamily)
VHLLFLPLDLNPYGVQVTKITINDAIPTADVQKQLDRQVNARINQNTSLVEAETKQRVAEFEIVSAINSFLNK